jgi:hypothetical protein
MVMALAFGSLLLLACAQSEATAKEIKTPPVSVEPIQGSAVSRVTLVQRAAERLAIRTDPVGEIPIAPRGIFGAPIIPRLVVPYSAVIYDLTGNTWVYTNPAPLVYVREPVHVDFVQDGTAVLFSGPPLGTQVVTAGGAELYGAETGVGK